MERYKPDIATETELELINAVRGVSSFGYSKDSWPTNMAAVSVTELLKGLSGFIRSVMVSEFSDEDSGYFHGKLQKLMALQKTLPDMCKAINFNNESVEKLSDRTKGLEDCIKELRAELNKATRVDRIGKWNTELLNYEHFKELVYDGAVRVVNGDFVNLGVYESNYAELKSQIETLQAHTQAALPPVQTEAALVPYEQRLIYNSERKYEWNGHAFRSEQEVRIAKALDARNVLFFPNAGCRVDEGDKRHTREVDFLVVMKGRMGVLECDGRSFHKIAADDHERDRNFQRQGITFIQRYDSTACLDADKVVDDFLKIMKDTFNI
ncbi:MAG: hypothetical protein ACRCU2_24170 [Planktothrix sp.]